MKYLILAVVIFAMQPAQTKDVQGRTQTKTAQSTHNTESTDAKNDKPQSPSVSVVVNTADNAKDTEQEKYETAENMRTQRRLVFFTGLLVLVGFLSVGAAILTVGFIGWQSWIAVASCP